MILNFLNKGLAELWSNGKTARIDARLHNRILRRLDRLDRTIAVEEMKVEGFNFHAFRGFTATRFRPRERALVHHLRVRELGCIGGGFRTISLRNFK